jgi:hypothetical protein
MRYVVKKPFNYGGTILAKGTRMDLKELDRRLATFVKHRFLVPVKVEGKKESVLTKKEVAKLVADQTEKQDKRGAK